MRATDNCCNIIIVYIVNYALNENRFYMWTPS